MAQFVAFDPKVETLGQAILSAVEGMGDEAHTYLAKHGLGEIKLDQWYMQQDFLNFLKAISEKQINAMFDLVGIGMKIPEHAVFPPQIDSIPSALMAIDMAYHMNNRNGEIGNYEVKVMGENSIDLICNNPFPCDFDYGLIYGMTRRFCPEDAQFVVRHDNHAACRQKGGDSCTYHVTWG